MEILNLSNRKIGELTLSLLYPELVKLPKNASVNLLFILSGENIFKSLEKESPEEPILRLKYILKHEIKLRLRIYHRGIFETADVFIGNNVEIKNGIPHIQEL